MNPLGNGNIGGLSPQIKNTIQQVKNAMQVLKGNPIGLIKQMNNPMANQVLKLLETKNPNEVFMSMAKEMGVDAEAILKELQS